MKTMGKGCWPVPALVLTLVWAGCGGDGSPTGMGTEDPALAPLVGRWSAVVFLVMTPDGADTVDVLGSGSTFTLEVEAAGRYSASLTTFGIATTESGQITIDSATRLTLRPTSPPGSSEQVTWEVRSGTLVLDGPTEFDFNQDQTSDPARAHIELRRS